MRYEEEAFFTHLQETHQKEKNMKGRKPKKCCCHKKVERTKKKLNPQLKRRGKKA
jgi:hypothetical protein